MCRWGSIKLGVQRHGKRWRYDMETLIASLPFVKWIDWFPSEMIRNAEFLLFSLHSAGSDRWKAMELMVICDVETFIRRHCNEVEKKWYRKLNMNKPWRLLSSWENIGTQNHWYFILRDHMHNGSDVFPQTTTCPVILPVDTIHYKKWPSVKTGSDPSWGRKGPAMNSNADAFVTLLNHC